MIFVMRKTQFSMKIDSFCEFWLVFLKFWHFCLNDLLNNKITGQMDLIAFKCIYPVTCGVFTHLKPILHHRLIDSNGTSVFC